MRNVDVKRAVNAAFAFVREMFEGEQISGLRLEAVLPDESAGGWIVTVSFRREPEVLNPSAEAKEAATLLLPERLERVYRNIDVNSGGEVYAMRAAENP